MASYYWPVTGGGGGGTVTGGANIGTGAGVFSGISGTVLQFRSLLSTATIAFTQNTNDITANLIGFGSLTTDNLTEGATNLYYTLARFNAAFATKTTDDLTEGTTNLYYTNERVDDRVAALIQTSTNINWVYDDVGGTLTGTVLNAAYQPRFAFWVDPTGELSYINGWEYYTNTFGANVNLSQFVTDTGGYSIHGWQFNLDPTEASPSAQYSNFNMQGTIDPNSTGFALGTGGSLSQMFNVGYSHNGTSDIGSLTIMNSYSNIGNGTDPIDIMGYYGFFVFGDINDNVNMSRGFQGYVFQPHVHSLATFSTSNAFSNIFGDFSNVECFVPGWTSYGANAQIAGIYNNSNYTGLNLNAQIGTLQGNAGYTGIYGGGSISVMGSQGYTGYQHNIQIANLTSNSRALNIGGVVTTGTADWIGIDIQTNQINTTGRIDGIKISVAPDPTYATERNALNVNGHIAQNVELTLASGLSQVYGNRIGGQMILPNATTITGTDVIFNNLGANIDLGDATSNYISPTGLIGMDSVGFVGQITGAGTADLVNFLLAGFSSAHSGNIAVANNIIAAAVPAGGGTVGEHRLFYGAMPFGTLNSGSSWGVRIDTPGLHNFFKENVVVGASSFKPTNSSVGIELNSTTQAVLLSRMTTVQRGALTAVDGMEIYNTTTGTFQDYTAGSWVDRGSGSIATTNSTSTSSSIILADKTLYFVDTSGGAVTLTLPAVSTTLCVRIKDKAGTANANPITISPPGAESIDGVAGSYVLDTDYGAWEINSDNTNYFIA